jgi:cytochrome c-type biogenesis protein CcmH/NrfG
LELSVQEDPNDDRNMHYLGREYMYYKQYQKCIDTLEKHLKLKSATWKDERSEIHS